MAKWIEARESADFVPLQRKHSAGFFQPFHVFQTKRLRPRGPARDRLSETGLF